MPKLTRDDFTRLLTLADELDEAKAAAKQPFTEAVEDARLGQGLDPWAFGIVRRLWRMEPAKAEPRIRNLVAYIELAGLGTQLDIDDVIDDSEAA